MSRAQSFELDSRQRYAHQLALDLRTKEALALVAEEQSPADLYVASLAEAIELLVTEDHNLFSSYEERFQARVARNVRSTPRDFQFLQAELRLHWAFVYLKFGHELDAALHLRQAHQIAEACRDRYPDYLPIRKTTGILEVILGSVPDKYTWVLSLLNMRGSIQTGLEDLRKIGDSAHPLAKEGKLLHALVQGFMLQRTEEAMSEMKRIREADPQNRLVLFLNASMALKNAESSLALTMLQQLPDTIERVPLYYADYLKGEAYLHRGDYLNSISSYRWFIQHQTGQNYIKDAYYKIGLCYWLNGNENDAMAIFSEARNKGLEATESDKSAARSLADEELPHPMLSKARYYTDGGYYPEAGRILAAISPKDLASKRDEVEFYYRKARLAHKLNQPEAAALYRKTIDLMPDESWYFAPNACLQLGYLLVADGKVPEAREFFEKALSYRRHEYKNSIDSKARSALAQLGRK